MNKMNDWNFDLLEISGIFHKLDPGDFCYVQFQHKMNFCFPRLPLFQGAAFEYVVPLLALQTLYPDRCDAGKPTGKYWLTTYRQVQTNTYHMFYIYLIICT